MEANKVFLLQHNRWSAVLFLTIYVTTLEVLKVFHPGSGLQRGGVMVFDVGGSGRVGVGLLGSYRY